MTQPEDHSVFPCFKCGKEIKFEPFTKGIIHAMSFFSYGGYGSAVYDPFELDGYTYRIRIHVCDDCVLTAGLHGVVMEAKIKRHPDEVTYHKWNPHSNDTTPE